MAMNRHGICLVGVESQTVGRRILPVRFTWSFLKKKWCC